MDIKVAVISIALYVLNNLYLKKITLGFLQMFFISYFNDVLAGIFFISVSNIILSFLKKRICELKRIVIILLCAGIIWEFFPILIHQNATCDMFDIIAYMLGGLIYWIIIKEKGAS